MEEKKNVDLNLEKKENFGDNDKKKVGKSLVESVLRGEISDWKARIVEDALETALFSSELKMDKESWMTKDAIEKAAIEIITEEDVNRWGNGLANSTSAENTEKSYSKELAKKIVEKLNREHPTH